MRSPFRNQKQLKKILIRNTLLKKQFWGPPQPKYLLSEPRIINVMFVVNSIRNFCVVIFFTATSTFAAGGGDNYVKDYKFSFEGPLGSFDQNQLQRGLKVCKPSSFDYTD